MNYIFLRCVIICFTVILTRVTTLFEDKYKDGLRKADRAINEQIDCVNVGILYL